MARVLVLALASGALAAGLALGQARVEAQAAAKPLPGLPAWTAGYTRWPKVNRAPIQPRGRGDAHGGTKNVYASKRAVRGRYPYGTVVVKEITRPRTRFVGVVAAMRKVRGANPRHNDWVMVEWERSTPRARFGVLAQGSVCTSCHVQARKNDYVFTRR